MHLVDQYRLAAAPAAVVAHYRKLTARADGSAADGPDAVAKAKFELAWQTDPVALTAAIESEADAVPEAEEEAQPSRSRRSRREQSSEKEVAP